jgi:3-isopropylmalate/(R)-2-methylmalate dehydratase large subunit
VILSIIGRIGVAGATHHLIEFAGPTIDAMNMEARMTLCNMAVEAGATSGICAPDATTVAYLWEFIKEEFATKQAALEAYRAFAADPDAAYEMAIEHRGDDLTPQTTDGFRPDNVKPVDRMAGTPIDQVYIGSCTNGRIEDLRVAAEVLKSKKVNAAVRGIISPATPKEYNHFNSSATNVLSSGRVTLNTGKLLGTAFLQTRSGLHLKPCVVIFYLNL